MRMEARPVTVMQPAMIPAIAQATATVMAPFAPASRESKTEFAESPAAPSAALLTVRNVRVCALCRRSIKKLTRPTAMAARMEYAAECDMVFAPEDTSQTSRISGRIR